MQIRGLHSTPLHVWLIRLHVIRFSMHVTICNVLRRLEEREREREAIARPSADFGNGRVRGRLRPPPKLNPRDS